MQSATSRFKETLQADRPIWIPLRPITPRLFTTAIVTLCTVWLCWIPVLAAGPVAIIGPVPIIHSTVPCKFVFTPGATQPPPDTVAVAGDFNNWSIHHNPMRLSGNGQWRTTIALMPGRQEYKFVVNGKTWLPDPNAPLALDSNPNNPGGPNSVLTVKSSWLAIAPAAANHFDPHTITFSPHSWRDQDVFGRHHVLLGIVARTGSLTHASVWIKPGPLPWKEYPLHNAGSVNGATRWNNVIHTQAADIGFYFKLRNGKATAYMAGGNFYAARLAALANRYLCHMQPQFNTPRWTRHAVWYQIFPERFRNGDKSNDPPHHVPWRWPWRKPYRPAGEHGDFYSYVYKRFYGGDIAGIQSELPYLRKLGITALYINPLFVAPSIHKYDPSDYRHIDDGFGVKGSLAKLHGESFTNPATWQWSASDKLFLAFVKQAHQQGFKVIVDVPFGHCGRFFGPFLNVLNFGRRSRFASWFQITSFGPPVQYKAWDKPNGSMPLFAHNKRLGLAAGPRGYFFAITRRWLAPNGKPQDGVDGFRLDSAPDVPHAFWQAWHKLVVSINPQACMDGEIWSPAQRWLNAGNQFTMVMNYPFATIATNFFCDQEQAIPQAIGPCKFGRQLSLLLGDYPFQVDLAQQNLLDSHDTDRFASRFVNMNLPFNTDDRLQDSNSNYDTSKPSRQDYTRMMQGVALQMSFVGSPMIYYGDEVGMWSAADPDDRQPMIWKDLEPYDDPRLTINTRLLHFYRRAIAARHTLPVLQTGAFGVLHCRADPDVLVFYRSMDHQTAYVALNRSRQTVVINIPAFRADWGHRLYDYLNRSDFAIKFPSANNMLQRPVLRLRPTAKAYHVVAGIITLKLAPWQTMILAGAKRAH